MPDPPPIPEASYLPYSSRLLVGSKVLVLSPHPDDESIGCGGTILLHRQAGDPVRVVILTDGSRGITALADRPVEAARIRAAEARDAARILEVGEPEFWGLPDRGLEVLPELVDRLVDLLRSYRPTLVYTTSPLEAHPDHRAAATLAWDALRKAGIGARLAFMESSQPLRPDLLVDISRVVDAKAGACRAHASQLAEHPYLEAAMGLARHRALTLGRDTTHAEAFALVEPERIAAGPVQLFLADQALPPGISPPGAAPLVSIVVRTRDRPALLCEALGSLVAQTWRPLEAIVVVDGGSDPAPVLEDFVGRLPIRVVRHQASRGRSAAADSGLAAARGRYVGFLDDDDLLHAGHVTKLVLALEASGALGAYGDAQRVRFRSEGSTLVAVGPPEPCLAFDFDRDLLYFENFLPIMTVLFRRDAVTDGLGFDPEFEVCEDWDFWIRLAARELVRVPGITADYRIYPGPAKDLAPGIRRIYAKHWAHWGPERLARATWPLVGRLKLLNTGLERGLAEARRAAEDAETRLQAAASAATAADRRSEMLARDLERGHQTAQALARELEREHEASQALTRELEREHEASQALTRELERERASTAAARLGHASELERLRGEIDALRASRAEILASRSFRLGRAVAGLLRSLPGMGATPPPPAAG